MKSKNLIITALLSFFSLNGNTQSIPELEFAFLTISQDKFNPEIKIFLEIDNQLFFVDQEKIATVTKKFLNKNKELAACRGWYAGFGADYWATFDDYGIIVYKQPKDEVSSTLQPKIIKKISFSEISAGGELKLEIEQKFNQSTNSGELEMFLGRWISLKGDKEITFYKNGADIAFKGNGYPNPINQEDRTFIKKQDKYISARLDFKDSGGVGYPLEYLPDKDHIKLNMTEYERKK